MITCNHDVSYLSISLSWLLNLFFTWALTSSSRFLSSELGTCHCKWPPDLVSTLWSHIACQVAVLSYLVVVVWCHLLVFDCCCCNFASWYFQKIFIARVDTASATRPGVLLIPLVMSIHSSHRWLVSTKVLSACHCEEVIQIKGVPMCELTCMCFAGSRNLWQSQKWFFG